MSQPALKVQPGGLSAVVAVERAKAARRLHRKADALATELAATNDMFAMLPVVRSRAIANELGAFWRETTKSAALAIVDDYSDNAEELLKLFREII